MNLKDAALKEAVRQIDDAARQKAEQDESAENVRRNNIQKHFRATPVPTGVHKVWDVKWEWTQGFLRNERVKAPTQIDAHVYNVDGLDVVYMSRDYPSSAMAHSPVLLCSCGRSYLGEAIRAPWGRDLSEDEYQAGLIKNIAESLRKSKSCPVCSAEQKSCPTCHKAW